MTPSYCWCFINPCLIHQFFGLVIQKNPIIYRGLFSTIQTVNWGFHPINQYYCPTNFAQSNGSQHRTWLKPPLSPRGSLRPRGSLKPWSFRGRQKNIPNRPRNEQPHLQKWQDGAPEAYYFRGFISSYTYLQPWFFIGFAGVIATL